MHAPLTLLLAFTLAAPVPGEPDLTTPRRALRHFIDSARAGDLPAAAAVLDRAALAARPGEGPRLARDLKLALDARIWIDWDAISDDPAGDPADGPAADLLGAVPLEGGPVAIRLVRDADGSWRFGPGTVAAIPLLLDGGGIGAVVERLPPALSRLRFLEVALWQWLGLGIALVLALAGAAVVVALARRAALRVTRRTRVAWDEALVEASVGPGRLLLAIGLAAAATRPLQLAVPAQATLDLLLRTAAIVGFTWAGVRGVAFGAALLDAGLQRAAGEAEARARLTMVRVVKRVADVALVVVGAALVLLQFEGMRTIGTSLLASAGVAGIAIGFAAQRSIATLFAGLQLTLSQRVRVGDVVVIEGEWGTVEEITLTYVVVRIWDLRRLVLPVTRFLDGPYQNWTRTGADILGTVFVAADYRVPVDEVRRELDRYVRTRPEWDGKVVGLQVTDATERTVQLRALVSSADASKNWDLRCAVREHLVGFLQRLEGGRHLPRTRLEGASLEGRNVAIGGPELRPAPADDARRV